MKAEKSPPEPVPRKDLLELLNSSSDLIIVLDRRYNIVNASASVYAQMGYCKENLVDRKVTTLFPTARRVADATRVFNSLRNKGEWTGELTLLRVDGSTVKVKANAIICRESGDCAVLTAEILTYRELLSQERWSSDESLRPVVESMPDGLLVFNSANVVVLCNTAMSHMIGECPTEIIGVRPPFAWINPATRPAFLRGLKIFQKEGGLQNYTLIWRRRDEAHRALSIAFSHLYDPSGAKSGFVVSARDLTGVQYVEDLRRADDQMHRLIDDVKRKAERLRTLQATNTLVLRYASISRIFQAITSGVKKLVPHDLAGIYVYDPAKQAFVSHTLSKLTHFSRKLAKFPLPLGEGIVGAAALSGKVVCVNNAQQDPRSRYPSGMKPDIEHVIAVPLKGRESIFGVIVVARNHDPGFIEEETLVVESFADAATVALENARLYQELRNSRKTGKNAPLPAAPSDDSSTAASENNRSRVTQKSVATRAD